MRADLAALSKLIRPISKERADELKRAAFVNRPAPRKVAA